MREELEVAAFHESGHAVAKWRLTVANALQEPGFIEIAVRTSQQAKTGPWRHNGRDYFGNGLTRMEPFDKSGEPIPENMEDWLFERVRNRMRQDILVALAGSAAEAHFRGMTLDQVFEQKDGGGENDRSLVALILERMQSDADELHRLKAVAVDFLTQRAVLPTVNALARRLLAERIVTGRAALDTLRANWKANDGEEGGWYI